MKTQHPVFKIIKDRATTGSKPGNRTDGAKVGVVVEGGGLRAVTSAAELVALQKMGYRDTVDAVYGESVGSGNAAWFLSAQLDKAIATYWELINNMSFINPLRTFRGGMVNTKFLREQVEKHYPYQYPAFVESGIKLNILAARADKPPKSQYNPLVMISQFENREDLLDALTAAVQMPFFGGAPYLYKGMQLWDGGILDKFPVQTAIEDGCTHILAVSSSPYDYHPTDHGWIEKYLIAQYFNKYNPDLGKICLGTKASYKQTMEFLRNKQENQDGPPYIATLALPAGSKRLGTFETNAKVLQQAASIAEQSTYKVFGN